MRAARTVGAGLLITLLLSALAAAPAGAQGADTDGDGLPDAWEDQFGLNRNSAAGADGAAGDPDLDGATNAVELARGTHPRGFYSEWFAEGSTGTFFDQRLALFNADGAASARVLVRFLPTGGTPVATSQVVPPRRRISINPETIAAVADTAFSTVVESDVPLAADRTMSWDVRHYGSHAETGTPRPSAVWYLAEGATHSGFDLFYLLMNPNPTPASVQVSYLLPAGAPIVLNYSVPAQSRYTIWVDNQAPGLAATDVSAVINANQPIVVERSMYLGTGGQQFGAGHTSMGVTAPALSWFLAEGATGGFFDMFVLIANPNVDTAQVAARYLLPDGSVINKTYTVGPRSRFNIWVDLEHPQLASTSVSTTLTSTNGVPIIVERAMWWPGGGWQEAHNSPGATSTSKRWALGEGEIGGAENTTTFILVANTSNRSGQVRLSLYFEDGSSGIVTPTLAANSRYTLDVAASFPQAAGKRFGTLVESLGSNPVDLVVERAMYSDGGGARWAAGTNALGMPVLDGMISGTQAATSGTIAVAAIAAADEGTQAAGAFRFTRSNGTGQMVVPFTIGGSAVPGQDYRAIPGVVVLAPGVLAADVAVVPVDDLLAEGNETVTVTLAPGPGYSISGSPTAVVTIADNDAGQSAAALATVASRLLNQAAFGPSEADMANLQAIGAEAWLETQFNTPPTSLVNFLNARRALEGYVDNRDVQMGWFTHAITGPDQLRQRVSAALLEVMVIGENGFDRPSYALGGYWDLLQRNAFGNFRTLMQQVTLSPAMGEYLDMRGSAKEDPATGRTADENYARELLQLFTIGQFRLNLDGTPQLDATSQPIPTYGQDEVKGFAKAFTGWNFFQTRSRPSWEYAEPDWLNPMMSFSEYHSTASKTLLDGVVLPPARTPEEDLAAALDNVFAHPNVGPFISKQLIQRLVTSNPSPAYVARVATVFNNNGNGVRGDLRAVIRAILLDHEARNATVASGPTYGKQKEPMIRFVAVLRALAARPGAEGFGIFDLQNDIGQAPFRSPSVFNFFRPEYAPQGPIAQAGLVAPEFQLTTEGNVISDFNEMREMIRRGSYGYDPYKVTLNFDSLTPLASSPDALIDRLNVVLMGGAMSAELRLWAREAIIGVSTSRPLDRVKTALLVIVYSPEFKVQK
jgi:uncharacterized protein (DUF1800 family)